METLSCRLPSEYPKDVERVYDPKLTALRLECSVFPLPGVCTPLLALRGRRSVSGESSPSLRAAPSVLVSGGPTVVPVGSPPSGRGHRFTTTTISSPTLNFSSVVTDWIPWTLTGSQRHPITPSVTPCRLTPSVPTQGLRLRHPYRGPVPTDETKPVYLESSSISVPVSPVGPRITRRNKDQFQRRQWTHRSVGE